MSKTNNQKMGKIKKLVLSKQGKKKIKTKSSAFFNTFISCVDFYWLSSQLYQDFCLRYDYSLYY